LDWKWFKKSNGKRYVNYNETPLVIQEVILPSIKNRVHSISLLYECSLISSLDENLRYEKGIPKSGEWGWHNKCPNDIIPVHEMYRTFI
jgi:colanic acid biosynthesis protein WcaH